jgi:hypothetical protein
MYFLDENEGEVPASPCVVDGFTVVNAVGHPGLVIPAIPMYNC